MTMLRVAMIGALALALTGCTAKAPVEPSEDELSAAVSTCANGGCKDFKKTSCTAVVIDPADHAQTFFKCQYSYVAAADAAAGPKSEEKCFHAADAGRWREGPCL